MRSEEEYDIGGSGIDTQYERDYINYKPTTEFEKEKTYRGTGYEPVELTHQIDLAAQLATSTAVGVWEEVIGVVETINLIENQLAEKLTELTVPLPKASSEKVRQAAEKMGFPTMGQAIPFALYKETFRIPDAPEAALIQEVVEDYLADVHGNLNAELYADVAEIQSDWNDVLKFAQKGLFAQIVPLDEAPTKLAMDDPYLEEVRKIEQLQMEEYLELLKLKVTNEDKMNQLAMTQYGSERYYQAENEYEKVKREVVQAEKKLFTKAEVVDLLARKASDAEDSLELISNSVDFDPYQEQKYEVLYALLQQFSSKKEMVSGLRKMQAVLQLSVDGKRHRHNAVKMNLRGLAGGKAKRRINHALVNGVHLRNGVFAEVYDVLRHFDGVPNIENFHMLTNHLSDGLEESEQLYKNQLSDFYKIHGMDTQLRQNKLTGLLDKDMARATYQLIEKVLAYATETDITWPTSDKLSEWVTDLMDQGKIH